MRVTWPKRLQDKGAKQCYGECGEVVQVCSRFIAVRSPNGYVFCVSRADMVEGTQLKVRGKVVAVSSSGFRLILSA